MPAAGSCRGLRRRVCGSRRPAPVGARRTAPRSQQRGRDRDNDGIIPVLARAVREVETAVERGPVTSSVRTKFQVVALLVREERARVKADESSAEAHRAEQLKRLDGVATILAKTAARDTSLLALLAEDAEVSDSARALKREMLRRPASRRSRRRSSPEPVGDPGAASVGWCRSRSSRASSPTRSSPPTSRSRAEQGPRGRLAGWELLGPLFRSFEYAGSGALGLHGAARADLAAGPGRVWS